ncbi:endoglucanase V-like protein [Lactifluus volemus]|nr:endoglucanase V-like protein [Lactifluus volemus]
MKAILVFVAFSSLAVAMNGPRCTESKSKEGYLQHPRGNASFTHYSGCQSPACGQTANGYTAAISQLTFGAKPGSGAGDACGRCFKVTGNHDPYSPNNKITPTSIIVMVNDMCPVAGNQQWCGQTHSHPTNDFYTTVHFDMCEDSGAARAFFPDGIGALTGTYEEVSCLEWKGTESTTKLWNGACLAPRTAAFWPTKACGNKDTPP